MLKKLSLALLLLSNSTFSVYVPKEKINSTNTSTLIDDGAIYFLRHSLYSNKVIDIPNSDYSNGVRPIIYDSNGFANQRFVLRGDVSFDNQKTFSLSPLYDYLKCLRLNGDNQKFVELNNINKKSSNLNEGKFIIEKSETPNAYRIRTGASNFTKYLTVENFSLVNGSRIIQDTFQPSNSKYYDWILERTDSLGINNEDKAYINGQNNTHFNIKVPVSGLYTLESSLYEKDLDTKMFVYNQNDAIIAEDDDSGEDRFSKIDAYFDSSKKYYLKLTGFNDSQIGYVKLKLSAKNNAFISTYYKEGDIDTRDDVNEPLSNFTNAGIFSKNLVNVSKYDMFFNSVDNQNNFNRKYYMLSSHGSENGVAVLAPDEYINGYELPDLSNVELSVWAICFGGKANNIADISVNKKNAKNSLSFPGLTYTTTSKTFTDVLWREVSKGENINDAIRYAISSTKSKHYWTHLFGWGDDTIISPVLYSKNSVSKFKQTANNEDVNVISLIKNKREIHNQQIKLNSNEQLFKVETNDGLFNFVLDEGIITNKYYFLDKKTNKSYEHSPSENVIESVQKINARQKIESVNIENVVLENMYNLIINGEYHKIKRVQYINFDGIFEKLNEVYYDIDSLEVYSEEEILNSFIV